MRIPFLFASLLLVSEGCLSAIYPYGVEGTVTLRQRERLGSADIERIREILRGVAVDNHLIPIDPRQGSRSEDGIQEGYVPETGGMSVGIGLWIPPDRSFANIAVNDWESVGEVSTRTREIEKRIRAELEVALPGADIEFKDEDLGFWGP